MQWMAGLAETHNWSKCSEYSATSEESVSCDLKAWRALWKTGERLEDLEVRED